MWEKLEKLYGKEAKKDGVPSCANLIQSSKVDGVLALDEPKTINSKFKKMISKLEFENDFLLKTKLDFKNQNETLKNDLEVSKTSNGVLEKENLDSKVKLESLTKEKEIISNNSSCHIMEKCSHCHYHGHSWHTCPIKKRKSYRIRQVWYPK
ncbi:hypothetical protein GQ457_08G025720 [Hibiscus cannabinus]